MLQCIYPASTADDYHATMLDAAVWNSATLRHAEDVPKQRGSAGKDAQSGFAWNAAAALRRARAQSNGWTVEDPYQIPGKPETHGSRFRCGELTTQTRSSSILGAWWDGGARGRSRPYDRWSRSPAGSPAALVPSSSTASRSLRRYCCAIQRKRDGDRSPATVLVCQSGEAVLLGSLALRWGALKSCDLALQLLHPCI
jgi:hypothetical protein